jgi:hypothetical protein
LGKLDASSFADKILAASSLASEGSAGEIEFAFTDKVMRDPSVKAKILNYAEEHSREGFAFDDYVSIKAGSSNRHSGRAPLVTSGSVKPAEEKVRGLLTFISSIGRLEDLVEYVTVDVNPKGTTMFYTQSRESKDMDPLLRERLKQLESKWAELPEFGRQLLTATFLIENDNSYEIEVERADGPFTGKEARVKEIVDTVFQSRLKLVRSFTK